MFDSKNEEAMAMYNQFVASASQIKGFVVGQKEDVPYDITELANAYRSACERCDEVAKNQMLSALMVRYWHLIPYLYEKSKGSGITLVDSAMWVYDGIEKAVRYGAWLDPNKHVSKEKKGAEKCINQAITSVRASWYEHSNRQIRSKDNQLLSLDTSAYQDDSGKSIPLVDDLPKDDFGLRSSVATTILMDSLLSQRKVTDALLVDMLMNGSAFPTRGGLRFSETLLASDLKSLDSSYAESFCEKYGFGDDGMVRGIVSKLHGMGQNDLLSLIRSKLGELRASRAVYEYAH